MSIKHKILETAYILFSEKGYDKTTVGEIIEKVGTSKGGFYHHFKSKEEILEALIFSYVDEMNYKYEEILKDNTMTLNDKIIKGFSEITEHKKNQIPEWDNMKKAYSFKGNHILFIKMASKFEEIVSDFYHSIFLEGNSTGVFNVKYPKQFSELWSREVIRFHRKANMYIQGVNNDITIIEDNLRFNEDLLNYYLSIKNSRIELYSIGMEYIEYAKSKEVK